MAQQEQAQSLGEVIGLMQRKASEYGVDVSRVSVNAGHCPQDEAPEEVNSALIAFAEEIEGGA